MLGGKQRKGTDMAIAVVSVQGLNGKWAGLMSEHTNSPSKSLERASEDAAIFHRLGFAVRIELLQPDEE